MGKSPRHTGVEHSFAEKVISERGHLIYKLKGSAPSGKKALYFIMLHPSKESEFLIKTKEGTVSLDLSEFGEVLASCYGHKVPGWLKKELKQKYRFRVK